MVSEFPHQRTRGLSPNSICDTGMRKFIASLLILSLGFALIWASKVIKQNPDKIQNAVVSIKGNCKPYEFRCKLVAPIVAQTETVSYGLKRKDLNKDDLPIMRVYMSDGAIAKLQAKRMSVLEKPRPIHISLKNDWVSAEVKVEYEDRQENSKVRLRLKGDWADHLVFPRKLSLRMKTKGGGYLFGMKTLSVQHPSTRSFGMGPMVLEHMRRHDIIAPRQRFVDLYVNDIPVGIMSMEEHFAKEMLESQSRRDGPILAINEDPQWAQWDVNFNVSPIKMGEDTNFFGYRDGTIKDFNKSKFVRGSIPTQNRLRGESLLRDFLDGEKPTSDVFDYEKTAKFWIITNIWNGCHGLIWHNRRFYFNPISGLLEPISFDNNAIPDNYLMCIDADIQAAFHDPYFVQAVTREIVVIREELQSEEFSTFLEDRQSAIQNIFSLEHFSTLKSTVTASTVVMPETLLENLNKLQSDIEQSLEDRQTLTGAEKRHYYGRTENGFMRFEEGPINSSFLDEQTQVTSKLTARLYSQGAKSILAVRNITFKDVNLQSIYIIGKKGKKINVRFTPSLLPGQNRQKGAFETLVDISEDALAKNNTIMLEYVFAGETISQPIDVQHRRMPTGFVDNPLVKIRASFPDILIDEENRTLTFPASNYEFDHSISLPRSWEVNLNAGSSINFRNGSLLKINGALHVNGSEEQPVVINVETNETVADIGSWGGILVSKANQRSQINHLRLHGTGTQNLKNRQGYFGMTGCLSFYESDVDIRNSNFINAQCEDALNIVKSDFSILNMLIEGARADAFDSDFSTGLIASSEFIASGNDGIDVSGTTLKIENITMKEIGDKAVSVGEKSTLTATNVEIDGAVLGLVSKDLSQARAEDIKFFNIKGTALMGYIKKAEYGPSLIECSRCSFNGKMDKTGQQEGNTIILNGEKILKTTLTRKQMLDAGLIEENMTQ